MKKQIKLTFLLTVLMSMVGTRVFAHDIEVPNANGKTIYYNYTNDGTELAVTYRGSSSFDYRGEYSGNVVIPEKVTYMSITRKVTSIGGGAFYECSGLTSVTIPNSVTSIGGGAFYECSGLTSVTIPNSVTSIGERAFYECSGLTSVTIPNSVTSIGERAFRGCSGLTSVTVEEGNSKYDSRDNCNAIIEKTTNTLVVGCKNTVIPNSVTGIGERAFYYCSGLTSVTIPNSVTSIGEGAFRGCNGLTSVTIGNGVTSIGESAFSSCHGLTSVTIGNSVTSIGESAFSSCSGLTSVTIPNSVTSIGTSAFACCGLTSVTIPNSVTSIGKYAFYDCYDLTSVTIGNSVTSIGDYAFEGADISTVISLIENPFTIEGKSTDNRTFSKKTFDNARLFVPKGTIDKYKATEGWKDFVFIKESEPSGITNIGREEGKELIRYTLDGKIAKSSHKGINIIQMDNGTTKKVVVK